jgi:hypothetical protein
MKRSHRYLLAFGFCVAVAAVTFQNCAVQQSSARQQLDAQGLASFQSTIECLPNYSSNSSGYVFGFDPLSATSPVPPGTLTRYTIANDACVIRQSSTDLTPDHVLICVQGPAQRDAVMEVVFGMKSPPANSTIPPTTAWIFPSTNPNQNAMASVYVPPSLLTLNTNAMAFWEINTSVTTGNTVLAVTGATNSAAINGVRCYMTFGPGTGGQPTVLSSTQQATAIGVLSRAVSVYVQTLN